MVGQQAGRRETFRHAERARAKGLLDRRRKRWPGSLAARQQKKQTEGRAHRPTLPPIYEGGVSLPLRRRYGPAAFETDWIRVA